MKKKLILTVGAVVATATLGLGIYHSNAAGEEPTLTTDEVESLVLSQYPGTITELELEKDFNKAVYEVEIEGDGMIYDLKLDGSSGEVLQLREKATVDASEKKDDVKENKQHELTVTEKKDDNKEQAKKEEKQAEKKAEEKSKPEQKSNKKDDNKNALIDASEASEIALNEFSGTITDLELDEEDGRLIYEIEIEDGELEAEIELDAYTGEVLVIEIDD